MNPYLVPPDRVLQRLFSDTGRTKGPIPVRVRMGGSTFQQTLVRYRGAWRLYLNTPMRKAWRLEVGDQATVVIAFDPRPRRYPMPPQLRQALDRDARARKAFDTLAPSRRKEIQRYLSSLKSEEAVVRNVERVMAHLAGQGPPELSALMRRPKRTP